MPYQGDEEILGKRKEEKKERKRKKEEVVEDEELKGTERRERVDGEGGKEEENE